MRERNVWLVSAGYAPFYPERALEDPSLAPARAVVDMMLERQKPYPAFALDRYHTIVASNGALPEMFDGVASALLEPPINAVRLSLHPQGMSPRIENLAQWRAYALRNLRREIEQTSDARLIALENEVLGYPAPGVPLPAEVEKETPMSKTVTTKDGTQLYVKDWGSGPVLFFVNGSGISSELFQYQHMYFLQKGFRVVTYDRRGHGKSEQPASGYDADTLADDMATVIATKGLKDITIIAHSFGCAEVSRYLTRHGEGGVKRVIFIGGTTPFLRKTATNPEGIEGSLIDRVRAGWTKDYAKWAEDSARPFFVPETSEALVRWVVPLLYETPVLVATEVNKTSTDTDFRPDVERIRVPTLIVHGDSDASCPFELTAKRTAKLIKHASLKVYEGGPHGLMFTHADRLHADIEGFIREA